MSIPQQDFVNKLHFIAQNINSEYGILQLSFELLGIDIDFNKDIYNQIIDVISSKNVDSKILINHVLKMIFKL